ncbi:MAG TPA: head GIN domain-containing protein [Phnomibacter sp.]|nr:head GIN domain-containing protein [Phnomibacter sp.]
MRSLIIFFFLVLMGISCRDVFQRVQGNGDIESKSFAFDDFEKVEVSGSFKVKIIPSDEHRAVITTDENLLQYIRIDRDGDRLKIRTRNNANLKPSRDINIEVYMTRVAKIELAGSGDIVSQSVLEHPDRLEVTIAGSGDANIDVKSPEIKSSIAGSGKIIIRGKTRDLNLRIAGSGDFLGEELMCETAELSIAGSGNARVFASVDLNVKIAGSGNVYYAGAPQNIKRSIAGAGVIKEIER